MTSEMPKQKLENQHLENEKPNRDIATEIETALMGELPESEVLRWAEKHAENFRTYVDEHGERLVEEYQSDPESVFQELRDKFFKNI